MHFRLQPYIVGNNPTEACNDQQQVSDTFLPKESDPPHAMECVRLCAAFQFSYMHEAGTQNTAAEFLSSVDLNPKERVELKIGEDITIRHSRDSRRNSRDRRGNITTKQQARQNAPHEETTKIKVTIKETAPIPINKASYTLEAIKEDARIRVEQYTNLVFKAIKRKLISEEYDKRLLQTNPRAKRLLVHEDRLIV